jgi:hypothetical protein
MPAIVRSGTGILACVFFLAPSSLRADTHADIVDLFASMAAALSDVNAPQFMAAFDKDTPGYDKLKSEISGLVNQAEISSSVEAVKDDGDEAKRTVDLDWYLQVRSLVPDGPIATRREVIHCELRKEGKHWKIVSLQPPEFFAPPRLDK